MRKKDKDFYVQTMSECIKSTYEWWGNDITSLYGHISKDFPNAYKALYKMYDKLKAPNFYGSKLITFKKVNYVYEAIANLIPNEPILKFDYFTQELSKKYSDLNMCSFNRYVKINRIDLILAALLFTEEFIFLPISSSNVILTNTKLTVYGNFVTFKISKHEEKTYISIKIRNVILLRYVILN